jgi:hypothetical protein
MKPTAYKWQSFGRFGYPTQWCPFVNWAQFNRTYSLLFGLRRSTSNVLLIRYDNGQLVKVRTKT